MISLLNTSFDNVPDSWIFEYYCNIPPLTGSRVKIHSIFQSEKTPSMYIYFRYGKYIYKDFCSGRGGSALNLVCELFSLSETDAKNKIVKDFFSNGVYTNITPAIEEQPGEILSYSERIWYEHDKKFWLQFHIGSTLLKLYNVRPLSEFVISKSGKEYKITGCNIYGYFKNDGTLYKIYQPYSKKSKFILVCDYLQGIEQIRGCSKLILTKSLKDIMAVRTFTSEFDLIGVDSENTFLNKARLITLSYSYKKLYILFDNDVPGKNATKVYLPHGFIDLNWNLDKDPAEGIKNQGYLKAKEHFISRFYENNDN